MLFNFNSSISPNSKTNYDIDLVSINFYDWNGRELYHGGAERYLIDLSHLIEESFGLKTRIVQNSFQPFYKNAENIDVFGIPATKNYDFHRFYTHYLNQRDKSPVAIVSPLELACVKTDQTVIGINHGIPWDSPANKRSNYSKQRYDYILDSLDNISKGVVVDTNFINWVRTIDYQMSTKLEYIPNYFDETIFPEQKKDFSDDMINILYPRRMSEQRGFYLLMDLIYYLLPKYKNISFTIAGQGDSTELSVLENIMQNFPDRIEYIVLDSKNMIKVYSRSQIVLIPTVNSEGTALSCIEAMATNNAIVATTVGGIPNLIIDKYNGLLIKPDSESLIKATEKLINNRSFRNTLAKKAFEVSVAFNKKKWDLKWIQFLKTFMVPKTKSPANPSRAL